jgi:hypothetical protein
VKLVRVCAALNDQPSVRWGGAFDEAALILLTFNWILTANLLRLREIGVYHTATAA